MRRKVKVHAILAVLTIVFACGYWVYAHLNPQSPIKTVHSEETVTDKAHRVPVVITPVSIRNFEERLVVQGNLEARNIALVHARVDATIESIFVDEGDDVVAGKTKLFKIDSLKLEKAAEVRRQALAVADCALNEKNANLERVEADLYKADIDYERSKKLLKDSTISSDEFERVESRHKQAVASHKHAQTLINLAKEQKRQAEAALEMAKKDFRDALVYAPISGKISQRFQEPGEMGDKKKPLLKIVDPSVIEVSAFLPAEYYPLIRQDETPMRIRVYGIELDEQVISYKSPTIHQKLRTFEIKCVVEAPPEGVVPGAMAEIEVLLAQRQGLGVPTVSLQQRGGRTVVFLVEKDVARMVEVETGFESDGWIELKGESLREKATVVTMGQFLLEEGTRVTVQKGVF
ncbi:MAG: efflux RND transporter periplasmic adaptor subunit [Deltaproteobacteria bacterium]|nr:efflux RND transporter periplasmic adaptor subunit [Deltaproteobacteria bacterium]